MAKNEYDAEVKTSKFFKESWAPWAIQVQLKPAAQRWYVTWDKVPESFEEWISQYTDRKSYPWVPYGDYFDEIDKYKQPPGAQVRLFSVDYWRQILEALERDPKEAAPDQIMLTPCARHRRRFLPAGRVR